MKQPIWSKAVWTVKLKEDGVIVVTSSYKLRENVNHEIELDDELNFFSWVPMYVRAMVLEARHYHAMRIRKNV